MNTETAGFLIAKAGAVTTGGSNPSKRSSTLEVECVLPKYSRQRAEARAQYRRVRDAIGREPTHIDTHHWVHDHPALEWAVGTLARETGDRKVDMLPLKEVQAATGYIRGGVTALACKKEYPVYIDELAEICDVLSVSGGMRGLQILLAPEDYILAVKARVVAIAKKK